MDRFLLTNAYSLNMFGIKVPPQDQSDVVSHRLRFDTIVENDVKGYLKRGELRSCIGHEGTAQILTERLGAPVAFNREDVLFPALGIDGLIVAQIAQRLPPGVELSVEQIRGLTIVYWTVTR